MRDTARYARQSDRELNPNFCRPWGKRPDAPSQPAPVRRPAAEPVLVTLARERDEWLRRRAARRSAGLRT